MTPDTEHFALVMVHKIRGPHATFERVFMKAPNYADAAQPEGEKNIHRGFITSRVLITERVPLVSHMDGKSIGQLVDEYIDKFNTNAKIDHLDNLASPELHSITVDFPLA